MNNELKPLECQQCDALRAQVDELVEALEQIREGAYALDDSWVLYVEMRGTHRLEDFIDQAIAKVKGGGV